jgi:hypothetical protein
VEVLTLDIGALGKRPRPPSDDYIPWTDRPNMITVDEWEKMKAEKAKQN